MIYMGLKRELEGSQLGFGLAYLQNGQVVEQRLSGLLYAEDVVLLADKELDMQCLTDICGEEATYLGLSFSTEKSRVMVFKDDAEQKSVQSNKR